MIIAGSFEASLQRAVVISLFTWRRAGPDDPLDDEERYGWWGDSFPTVPDDRIGSRLWLLRRAKLTTATRRDAEYYAKEAMQWLLDDSEVVAIEILTEQVTGNRLNLGVIFTLSSGQHMQFDPNDQWQVIYAV